MREVDQQLSMIGLPLAGLPVCESACNNDPSEGMIGVEN